MVELLLERSTTAPTITFSSAGCSPVESGRRGSIDAAIGHHASSDHLDAASSFAAARSADGGIRRAALEPPIGPLHDCPIATYGERRPGSAAPFRCPSSTARRPAWWEGAADAARRRVEADRLHDIGTVDAIRLVMSAGPGDPHQGHPIRCGQATLVEDPLQTGIVLAGEDAVDRRQADVLLLARRDPPVDRIQGLIHVKRLDADAQNVHSRWDIAHCSSPLSDRNIASQPRSWVPDRLTRLSGQGALWILPLRNAGPSLCDPRNGTQIDDDRRAGTRNEMHPRTPAASGILPATWFVQCTLKFDEMACATHPFTGFALLLVEKG